MITIKSSIRNINRFYSCGFNVPPTGLLRRTAFPCLPNLLVTRTLYARETLGVNTYENKREIIKCRIVDAEEFKEDIRSGMLDGASLSFCEADLINTLHLVEDKPDDYTLLRRMLHRFHEHQKFEVGTKKLWIGPTVMRAYFYLNEPHKALEVFHDPELQGMFDQSTTCHILCDLLYNHEMYSDTLQVYDTVRKSQKNKFYYPAVSTTIALAACYKLNNPESLAWAVKTVGGAIERGRQLSTRGTNLVAALAVARNSPLVALLLLSTVKSPNYFTFRNLKIAAYAQMDRPQDALSMFSQGLRVKFDGQTPKPLLYRAVLEDVQAAVERSEDNNLQEQFAQMVTTFNERNMIIEETMDVHLTSEIQYIPREDSEHARDASDSVEFMDNESRQKWSPRVKEGQGNASSWQGSKEFRQVNEVRQSANRHYNPQQGHNSYINRTDKHYPGFSERNSRGQNYRNQRVSYEDEEEEEEEDEEYSVPTKRRQQFQRNANSSYDRRDRHPYSHSQDSYNIDQDYNRSPQSKSWSNNSRSHTQARESEMFNQNSGRRRQQHLQDEYDDDDFSNPSMKQEFEKWNDPDRKRGFRGRARKNRESEPMD